jgi:hypothetical protein
MSNIIELYNRAKQELILDQIKSNDNEGGGEEY